jgi:lysozyme
MNKITKISDNCVKIAIHYECSGNVNRFLKAYLCPAGVWTIGIGTTYYPNGTKVKSGDIITEEEAHKLYNYNLRFTEAFVDSVTTDKINQNQFDVLVDFAYNKGHNALRTSNLLRKINANTSDLTIPNEFAKWLYGGDGTKNGVDDDKDGLIDEPGERKYQRGLDKRQKTWSELFCNNQLILL